MKLNFSTASAKHIKDLVSFVNSAYRGDSSRSGWTTEADLLDGQRIDFDMLKNLLQSSENVILLAHDSEHPANLVGCVHLDFSNPKLCYLGMLTIKPGLQNHGLGRQLLEAAESLARSRSCQGMTMSVLSLRKELIDWYLRRGYQMTKEKKPFPYGDIRFGQPNRPDLEFLVLTKNFE